MLQSDRIPFLPRRSMVAVFVTVNDQKDFALLVDTGAERMALSRRAAAPLGFDLTHPLRREPLAGVGQTAPIPVVRLNNVQVGSSKIDGLLASVFDLPPLFNADGILGLNFLNRFRVTFEFDTRILVLRALRRMPRSLSETRFERRSST